MWQQSKAKLGAFALFGLHPDPSAIPLNNTLADRQPNASARVLVRCMKPLENSEYLLLISGRNANPVIGETEFVEPINLLTGHLNTRRHLWLAVFNRVPDQILKQLR